MRTAQEQTAEKQTEMLSQKWIHRVGDQLSATCCGLSTCNSGQESKLEARIHLECVLSGVIKHGVLENWPFLGDVPIETPTHGEFAGEVGYTLWKRNITIENG